MIVDCHSHIWPSRSQLGQAESFSCLNSPQAALPSPRRHLAASNPAEVVLVHGFVSSLLQAEIPNAFVHYYMTQYPQRILGFAGIDPTQKNACDELRDLHDQQGFVGFTLSPACQGLHPCDSRLLLLYELAVKLAMPVFFLQGMTLPHAAILEFACTAALDEVARSFPSLKIVISHMGYPWVEQTFALLAKHENVFTDIAGFAVKPFQAYRYLTLAYECGVIDKIFFASDFPCATVKTAIETLYKLSKFALDARIPAVPRECLRGIVERDSLALLGLTSPAPPGAPVTAAPEEDTWSV
jgi:uncharacterized protein